MLKAKHVLGGLKLGDLRHLFHGPVVVFLDDVQFMSCRVRDFLELWWWEPTDDRPCNLRIRLSIPVKVEDGKIILSPDNAEGFTMMTLGRMEFPPNMLWPNWKFVQTRVEIPIS